MRLTWNESAVGVSVLLIDARPHMPALMSIYGEYGNSEAVLVSQWAADTL